MPLKHIFCWLKLFVFFITNEVLLNTAHYHCRQKNCNATDVHAGEQNRQNASSPQSYCSSHSRVLEPRRRLRWRSVQRPARRRTKAGTQFRYQQREKNNTKKQQQKNSLFCTTIVTSISSQASLEERSKVSSIPQHQLTFSNMALWRRQTATSLVQTQWRTKKIKNKQEKWQKGKKRLN